MKKFIQILIGIVFWMLASSAKIYAATSVDTGIGTIVATESGLVIFATRFMIGTGLGIAVIKGGSAIWKWRNAESPDKKQDAASELTTAIVGLMLIFISIPLLRFIGVDILGLNQFGGGVLCGIAGTACP